MTRYPVTRYQVTRYPGSRRRPELKLRGFTPMDSNGFQWTAPNLNHNRNSTPNPNGRTAGSSMHPSPDERQPQSIPPEDEGLTSMEAYLNM